RHARAALPRGLHREEDSQPAPRGVHEPAARTGIRLRRAPAVPPRRRRAADRLERDGADERALRAPHPRRARAERDGRARRVALDVSRSMELGTSHYSKKEVLTFITGSLLFSALSDQINTGFMAFADRVVAFHQPKRTRGAAWTILEQCWSLAPQPGPTALGPAVQYLARMLKKTSVVFLVSDFMSDAHLFARPDLA